MTHTSFHTGDHFICSACEAPWPCETVRLANQVESMHEAIAQALSCTQLRCRGCRLVLQRSLHPSNYHEGGHSTTFMVDG